MKKLFKFELGKKNTNRLLNFVNSSEFKQDKNISEHWSKRQEGNQNSFKIKGNHILFDPTFNTGLSFNFSNYLFKNKTQINKLNIKSLIKKKILNLFKIYYAENFSSIKYFNQCWSNNPNLKYSIQQITEEFGNHDDYIIYNAAWFYNEIKNYYIDNLKINRDINRCIEVGSGVGNLIRIMLADNFISNATIVDLPSSIPFSFCNLIKRFPSIDYLLPNEINAHDNFYNHKLLFLTNSQINLLPKNFYSLGVNTMSFGEMDIKTINEYFGLFRNVLNKDNIFYCLNRVEKIMKINNKKEILRFSEYPWKSADDDIHYQLSFVEKFRNFNPMYLKVTQLSK